MVKRLYENQMKEYIEKYINQGNHSKLWISLNLGEGRIRQWINEGKFAHLKKELQIYQNLEFGCLKDNESCHYIFFIKNKKAYWRINSLLNCLMSGFKVPLIKCSTIEHQSEWNNNTIPISGQYNVCPLF